jgi:NarL family two-component system sensor histidine kinase YdfH
MTIILVIMYIVSLNSNPGLRQFWPAALFTFLMLTHTLLHLVAYRIIQTPARTVLYILGQGVIAYSIVNLSGNIGMIYALYMALIGESVGILGLTRWGALATIYFLGLSLVNFIVFTSPGSALYWFVGTIPTVIFVGLYVSLYMRQTEAREKAQALAAELETANRQLSEYAARVEDLTIAAERERLARDLHDTLSQGLAGLILQLEAADAHLTHDRPEKARTIVRQSMENARSTLSDARRAISDLRENKLGELGESLRREIDRFEAATGIPCLFHADATPHLPEPVKETILRTVSEALTNTARHAQASQAAVTITVKGQTLKLEIKDNGIGFDPQNIPSGHYGLLGIRERIRLTGGALTLDSAPQKGTILTIEILL